MRYSVFLSGILLRLRVAVVVPIIFKVLDEDFAFYQGKTGKSSLASEIRALSKALGTPRKYNFELHPKDPANIEAIHDWLEWWDEHNHEPKYQIPTPAPNDEPPPIRGRQKALK